ncbi:binding partner of ACD11 1 isoform X2 [Phalaenopsis equestris]|uniref:binding partner of ACD11 1 isoform X2 n=1 Tax=Phalaenopsis equestris TaxID=78828 RepID=UPI0009E432C9|nr:binding partner of ACD11 1 isoform X2 [Phalaenopsis equestris]
MSVGNVSDLAGEREIREFFSFSGDIESVEIRSGAGVPRIAFVTFKESKAAEIAVLLSGATIVDQMVTIKPVIYYVPKIQEQVIVIEDAVTSLENPRPTETAGIHGNRKVYVDKAHDVVAGILARGSALRQDAVNKAKAFDEKHQLSANASARVISFDRRVGLSEKFTLGITTVNEKVKSVDQRLHVSDKTMAVITVAEQKLSDTGTAVKTNRYVMAGTNWLNGAFGKVARVGHVASSKTREKFQFAVSNLTAKESVVAV